MAQTVAVPPVQDAQAQAWLAEMTGDVALIRPNPAAFFAAPDSAKPLPCEVPREDLIHMVSAVSLADETPEVRRAFTRTMRMMGAEYASATYGYSNLNVQAVKAQCKDGKLDGETELWATMDFVNDNAGFKMYRTDHRRVYFNAVDGKPVGRIRRLTRSLNVGTLYKDPATQAMMAAANLPKTLEVWVAQYALFRNEAPGVVYAYTHVTGLVQQETKVALPLPNGRVETSVYMGGQITSKSQTRHGVPHGVSIVYPHVMGGGLKIDKMIVTCARNGEIYKADPCDVD